MPQEAGLYLRNELRAHAAAYKAIKALPGEKYCYLLAGACYCACAYVCLLHSQSREVADT